MLQLHHVFYILMAALPLHFFLNMITYKKMQAKANIYLAAFMLVIFLQYFFLFGEVFQHPRLAILSYYIVIPLMLLGGPFLFLYCRKLTSEKFKLWPEIIIHILPAIIVVFFNVFTFGKVEYDIKYQIVTHQFAGGVICPPLELFLKTYKTAQIFYNIQVLVYSVLMIFILVMHSKRIKNFFSYTEKINLHWLKVYVIMFASITLVDVFLYKEISQEFYSIIMLTYIGFVGFFGIRQSDIYSTERIKVISSGKMTLTQVESALEDEDNNLDKSQKILLSTDQIDLIVKKIEEALVEKKMFTNSKLSLEDLAQEVEIHKNSLSYVINAKIGKNFYQLINEFRIKEAMKLFHDDKLDHISIEGIAQTVGFNSKSVFNPIFKKIVGKTPSEYRKMKNSQRE